MIADATAEVFSAIAEEAGRLGGAFDLPDQVRVEDLGHFAGDAEFFSQFAE